MRPATQEGKPLPRIAIILAAVAMAVSGARAATAPGAAASASEFAKLGLGIENVELVDDTGERVRWGNLKGRPRALFFGFTRCPVICPVTVWAIDAALEQIGATAGQVQMNFVSLDPERDTPEAMHNYFLSFKARMRALTGSIQAIGRVAKAFDVAHDKVALQGGDYTIDHTAAVFLIDESGKVVDVLGYGTPQDVMVARLKNLLRIP
jgi:protein SCO1/2